MTVRKVWFSFVARFFSLVFTTHTTRSLINKTRSPGPGRTVGAKNIELQRPVPVEQKWGEHGAGPVAPSRGRGAAAAARGPRTSRGGSPDRVRRSLPAGRGCRRRHCGCTLQTPATWKWRLRSGLRPKAGEASGGTACGGTASGGEDGSTPLCAHSAARGAAASDRVHLASTNGVARPGAHGPEGARPGKGASAQQATARSSTTIHGHGRTARSSTVGQAPLGHAPAQGLCGQARAPAHTAKQCRGLEQGHIATNGRPVRRRQDMLR